MGSLVMAGESGIMKVKAAGDVATTMDALAAAVSGATLFARVDHGAGAAGAGMELAP